MKNTLYIHIGQYKTGTTSIQKACKVNADKLSNQGFWYGGKDDLCMYQNQHNPLVSSIYQVRDEYLPEKSIYRTDIPIKSYLEELDSRSESNALISSEAFYARSELIEGHQKIKRFFKKRFEHLKIIAYLRRHDDWYVSLMQQHLRSGRVLHNNPMDVLRHEHYLISKQLGFWSDVFGTENIIVRPFDRRKWINSDLLQDFYNILGVDPSNFRVIEDQNTSLTYQQMLVLNMLNNVSVPLNAFDSKFRLPSHELRSILLSFKEVLTKGTPSDLISYDQRAEILDYFFHDIETINDKYGQGSPIFEIDLTGKDQNENARLDEHDLAVLIKRLLIEIREQRNKLSS